MTPSSVGDQFVDVRRRETRVAWHAATVLGQSRIEILITTVGRLRADLTRIRGEGGPLAPALVVPIEVEMFGLGEETLVLERLEATLWTRPNTGSRARVSIPASIDGTSGPGGPLRSLPQGASPHIVELRFPVAAGELHLLTSHAENAGAAPVILELAFEARVGWLRSVIGDPTRPESLGPFGHSVGLASDMVHFWSSRVEEMQLELSRERWAEEIAPALGYDRLRLVAVGFPAVGSPLGAEIVSVFDQARAACDAGQWRECVQKCRDVRHLAEERLKDTRPDKVAQIAARRAGLRDDDPQIVFLDAAWKALGDFTSQAHHLQTIGRLTGSSARTALLMTATLLQYLGELTATGN